MTVCEGDDDTSAGERRVSLLLFLSIAAILAVTLTPTEEWDGAKDHVLCALCGERPLADAFGNLLLFFPLGLALSISGYRTRRALLFSALLSFGIESTQFVIPGRDPHLGDFLFNVSGAALGHAFLRTTAGKKLERGLLLCVRVLSKPEPSAAARLALGSASAAVAVFWLTAVLLSPAPPPGTYWGGTHLLQPTVAPLRLGGGPNSNDHFEGILDEVRIYKRALNAAEIEHDMNVQVRAVGKSAPADSDLVAAYGFDEGAGTTVRDDSGRSNTGILSRPCCWTSQGKFGGALDLQGVDEGVLIPDAPSLDLTSDMTLEAWIYPTSADPGWAEVVQKDVDSYFLAAGSDAGPLRPAAGGTFGVQGETLKAPAALPVATWTHLAATYDGSSLRLYVNGTQVAARARWVHGRMIDASVGGHEISAGINSDSPGLRAQLLAGAPVQARAVIGPSLADLVPFLTLFDQHFREILFLGRRGDDAVFRLRTRGAAIGLHTPAVRFGGVLSGVGPEDVATVTVSRLKREYCVEVNGTSSCGFGYTVGSGWPLLVYSQLPSPIVQRLLTACWLAILCFLPGFWSRSGPAFLGAVLIVAGGLFLLPSVAGLLATPSGQVAAAAGGLLAGSACRWMFQKRPTGSGL